MLLDRFKNMLGMIKVQNAGKACEYPITATCPLTEANLRRANPRISGWSLDVLLRYGNRGGLRYIDAYNTYRAWASEYLIRKLMLQTYDAEVEDSGLGFEAIPKSRMDMYQYATSDVLKYFFVRNNVYVENLNTREWDFVAKHVRRDLREVLDVRVESFVEQTMGRVLKEYCFHDGHDLSCLVQFGPSAREFFAPNDAIVLGFRYDDFFKADGEDDGIWTKRYYEQLQFLPSLLERLEADAASKLGAQKVKILSYDDFSSGSVVASMQKPPQPGTPEPMTADQTAKFEAKIDGLVRDFMATIDDVSPMGQELEAALREKLWSMVQHGYFQTDGTWWLSDGDVEGSLDNTTRELCEKSDEEKCRALLQDDGLELLQSIRLSLQNAVLFQSVHGIVCGCVDYDELRRSMLAILHNVRPWNTSKAERLANESLEHLRTLTSAS